jgi:endonuclease/exonuclease/phosphatase family metal-dependent hydrolase
VLVVLTVLALHGRAEAGLAAQCRKGCQPAVARCGAESGQRRITPSRPDWSRVADPAPLECDPNVPREPRPKLPQLPQGRFWFYEPVQELGQAVDGADKQSLLIEGESVSVPGYCPAVHAEFGVDPRDDSLITVQATWEGCLESRGPISFHGYVDALDLGTIQGTFTFPTLPPIDVSGAKSYGASLRMVTYNVQALPSTFNPGTVAWKHEAIVEEILKSGYDVVALNEVFDEDMRKIYAQGLKNAFPHHILKISGDGTFPNEDSGLMLFSRWKFLPLPNPTYASIPAPSEWLYSGGWAEGLPLNGVICQASDCSRVAAIEFDDCEEDDCWAEKGAAMVRLENPETGDVANVVVTHLQASYPPGTYPSELEAVSDAQEEFLTRREQLEDIAFMIYGTVGVPNLSNSEPIFILGDLNVDGDLTNWMLTWNQVNLENLLEWDARWGAEPNFTDMALPGFPFTNFEDGWALENAPPDPSGHFDRGITRVSQWGAVDGARFDYVLWNPDARVCIQHMTLALNLRWGDGFESGFGPTGIGLGGATDLSDHFGVNADVNLPAPHCNPATAESHTLSPGVVTTFLDALDHPGQIHWYRFEEPGTYSFEMQGTSGADFRVYEGDDLSTPAPQYKNETTHLFVPAGPKGGGYTFHGKQYRIAEAPFYVRVWNPDRAATGDYSFRALKHDCATRATACALGPGQQIDHHMPENPPVGQPDEAWFELYSEEVNTGKEQQLAFWVGVAAQAQADGVFDLTVWKVENGQLVLVDVVDTQLQVSDPQAERVKYYLQIQRKPPYAPPYPIQAQDYSVGFTTNLVILYGSHYGGKNSLNLFCQEVDDASPPWNDGNDEIYIDYIKADGDVIVPLTWVGDIANSAPESLESIIPQPVHFFKHIKVKIFDDDKAFNGDNDYASGYIFADYLWPTDPGPFEGVLALGPLGNGSDGGHYVLYYNLTHGFDF